MITTARRGDPDSGISVAIVHGMWRFIPLTRRCQPRRSASPQTSDERTGTTGPFPSLPAFQQAEQFFIHNPPHKTHPAFSITCQPHPQNPPHPPVTLKSKKAAYSPRSSSFRRRVRRPIALGGGKGRIHPWSDVRKAALVASFRNLVRSPNGFVSLPRLRP